MQNRKQKLDERWTGRDACRVCKLKNLTFETVYGAKFELVNGGIIWSWLISTKDVNDGRDQVT